MASPINQQPEGAAPLPLPAVPVGDNLGPQTLGDVPLRPTQDQIAPSAMPLNQQVKRPDAPELPIRSHRAVQREAVKEEAKQRLVQAVIVANPRFAEPNNLAALLAVLMDVEQNMIQSSLTASNIKRLMEQFKVELGIGSAERTMTKGQLEANKEMVRAFGSFLNAAVSATQVYSTATARSKAEEAVNKEGLNDKIANKKTEIQGFKDLIEERRRVEGQDLGINPREGVAPADLATPERQAEIAAYDARVAARTQRLEELRTLNPDEKLKQANKELGQLEHDKLTFFQAERDHASKTSQAIGELVKQTSEGCVGVLTSLFSKEIAHQESLSKLVEQLMQVLQSGQDTANKAKDETLQTLQSFRQQRERASEANLNVTRIGRN